MIYDDVIIERAIPVDNDFPYEVSWIYPSKLKNEKIFIDNIKHTYNDLKQLVKYQKQLENEKKVLFRLQFDSQISKQKEIINIIETKIEETIKRLNDGISPYYWSVHYSKGIMYNDIHLEGYILALENI
jgi:hypothetical protein